MGKSRRPRKRKDPAAENDVAEEQESERQTERKGELVPPPPPPPAAVAAETHVPAPRTRGLSEFFAALRAVAGAMIDIADAAAAALRKGLEGRA